MMLQAIRVHFWGGAGAVTGSKFVVEGASRKIMVDCGMFQGLKNLKDLNREPLPIDSREIDAVILTHAHLDHTGYLPLLVKQGFSGSIYCSDPTQALTEIILRDSAKLQEEEAARANKEGYSKHAPALPLYDSRDAEKVLPLLSVQPLEEWIQIFPGIRFRFRNSGHILGSVFVELEIDSKRLVFSGDLGRENPLTLKPRVKIEQADYLWIESTYGDRKHPKEDVFGRFASIIESTVHRGGQVLIPSFAVGRTQDILYILEKLKASNSIPNIPIYIDSPMAVQTTRVFDRYDEWHRLGNEDLLAMKHAVTLVSTGDASVQLQRNASPAIIIAGSGMMAGGRILAHALQKLSDPKNTFILVGFQASGTIGRFLKEGSDEVKIFGRYIPVSAKIEVIDSLSAHADQGEIIQWLSGFRQPPKKTFVIHGEPHSANALRVRIRDALGWDAVVPELWESTVLE